MAAHLLQAGLAGNRSRNDRGTKRGFQQRAERIAAKLTNMRYRQGLMSAYGEKAERLGLGQRTPPSRRARGAPPGQTQLDIPA